MTTLSPSKAHSTPGYGSVAIDNNQHSRQSAARVPRSALAESNDAGTSPCTASVTAIQALEAFSANDLLDGTLPSSGSGSELASPGTATSTSKSTHNPCESDIDSQSTSDSSIDIITERNTMTDGDVRTASPRKSLPTRWLSSKPPPSPNTQGDGARAEAETGSGRPPSDHGTLRTTQSSLEVGNASVVKATFLTKEALDAVNANMTSPILRRSSPKMQQAPAKQPWNSPTVAHKSGSPQRSSGSPTRPSMPQTAFIRSHVVAEHRRAPSSVVSTGATTFHTAHGSPVRSSAFSHSSYSSAEELLEAQSQSPTAFADMDQMHLSESHSSGSKKNTVRSPTKVRARPSKPEISINIPSRDSVSGATQTPVSALSSATSSPDRASSELDRPGVSNTSISAMPSSRIPRMSSSKGSTVRAPTLSSTLKQTKSAQTLRSPKASNETTDSNRAPGSKMSPTRSPRHVRTLDSAGSTPIILDRKSRNFDIPASTVRVSPTQTGNTSRATEDRVDTRTPSRATSTSTIRAPKADRGSSMTGNVHSSDADDEYDDSAASAPSSEQDTQSALPPRGRITSSLRRATISDISSHSTSASNLRATAAEFVPAGNTTSGSRVAASNKLPLTLPGLFALDGYGIPWYYHMYPIPCLLPPIYATGRTKSPRKLRPRKQRSTPGDSAQDQDHEVAFVDSGRAEGSAGASTSQLKSIASDRLAAVSGVIPASTTTDSITSSTGPFASQFEEVTLQDSRQTGTRNARPLQDDLTTIRNVAARGGSQQSSVQGYHTLPTRRRGHRYTDNGLYDARGNVGVPLHATAPFPTPVPPVGRPIHQYVGYSVGTGACGTFDIKKAHEHVGKLTCNTCASND